MGARGQVDNQTWDKNTGNINSFQEHTYTTSYTKTDVFVAFKDLNGDGRGDILLSPSEKSGQTYRISWFEQPGDPTGIWTERIIEDNIEAVHHFVGAGDFDKDGENDVLTAEMHQGADPDEIKCFYNGGQGLTWTKQVVSTQSNHSMRIFDANNDGDIDCYGANWNSGAPSGAPVELWLNRSDTPWPLDQWRYSLLDNSRERFSGSNPYLGLDFGDLNNDDVPDIVSGKYYYLNLGGNITSAFTRGTFPINSDAMLIVNIDHDEFSDVIATALRNVYWFEQPTNSTSSWTRRQAASLDTTNGMDVGDFD